VIRLQGAWGFLEPYHTEATLMSRWGDAHVVDCVSHPLGKCVRYTSVRVALRHLAWGDETRFFRRGM
jgi:hypothetical protein